MKSCLLERDTTLKNLLSCPESWDDALGLLGSSPGSPSADRKWVRLSRRCGPSRRQGSQAEIRPSPHPWCRKSRFPPQGWWLAITSVEWCARLPETSGELLRGSWTNPAGTYDTTAKCLRANVWNNSQEAASSRTSHCVFGFQGPVWRRKVIFNLFFESQHISTHSPPTKTWQIKCHSLCANHSCIHWHHHSFIYTHAVWDQELSCTTSRQPRSH